MKKAYTCLFILFASLCSTAQTFTFNSTVGIPDNGQEICIPLAVSGLPNQINSTFGLAQACINIYHTYDADLVIQIESPDGTRNKLSAGNGGWGQNYLGTCFAMNGVDGFIAQGNAPFTGTFVPQTSLNAHNNNQDPNGTWKLCITDTYPFSDSGWVTNWSITFANNPPVDPPSPPVICTFCNCPSGSDTCELLPDITASYKAINDSWYEIPTKVYFGNATPNIGWGPLEIHGVDSCFCNDTIPVPCTTTCGNGPIKHLIKQRVYVYQNSDTLAYYDRTAGKMTYHANHGHLHIDDWADYSLRVQTNDPDARNWPIVGTSTKQSFCLINLSDCSSDYGYCKDTLGNILNMNQVPNSGFGLYTGCGLDQGIYPGYLDIYDSQLNDPIDVTGICKGNYFIVSVVDPFNRMKEITKSNNWTAVPVTLNAQNNPTGVCSFNSTQNGLTVTFNNTTPNLVYSYLWDFGDGKDTVAYNAVHTYASYGTYNVTLTALNHCYTAFTNPLVVGVNEYDGANLFLKAFPNPFRNSTNVRYTLPKKMPVTVELTSLLGERALLVANQMQDSGEHNLEIDAASWNLRAGVYFLRVITPEASSKLKLVIQ